MDLSTYWLYLSSISLALSNYLPYFFIVTVKDLPCDAVALSLYCLTKTPDLQMVLPLYRYCLTKLPALPLALP